MSGTMAVEQGSDRLSIKYDPEKTNLLFGILYLILAIIIVIYAINYSSFYGDGYYENVQQLDASGRAFAIIIALVIGFLGARILFTRSDIYYFDRSTGEFTVLHQALVTKKEVYPLSDIKRVVLVTDLSGRLPKNLTFYYVLLLLGRTTSDAGQPERRLQITAGDVDWAGKQAKAEELAAFLGLDVQEETIE